MPFHRALVRPTRVAGGIACYATLVSAAALAQPAPSAPTPAPAPTATESPPPGLWVDGIHLSAQIEAGIMGNPSGPADGLNFGQLFTDRANQVVMNQLLLTANKPLDPKDPDYQWGFKLQFMYGTDARYTQFLGELNRVDPNSRYQLDVVEANVLAHLPWLTEGGIDLKVGQYPTPLGYETIDPSTNLFYSHSYIFQFGLPFKHTGALSITHVNDMLDVYSGFDTGTNTTFGPLGDNNGAVGGIAQFDHPGADAFWTRTADPGPVSRRGQRQRQMALLQRYSDHLESDREADTSDRGQPGPRQLWHGQQAGERLRPCPVRILRRD